MLDSCSVIIRKALGSEQAVLGVRAAWAMMGNGGLEVKVLLMGEGVYSALGRGGYVRGMFERFIAEDGKVYAISEDLAERGISEGSLPSGVELVPAAEVSELVLDSGAVMTF